MTSEQFFKNLNSPSSIIDVVLDTDAYNEIDDQFAIAYLLKSDDKLDTKAIYAAPFLNSRSSSAGDGMEKSYNELVHILTPFLLVCTEKEKPTQNRVGYFLFFIVKFTEIVANYFTQML